MNDDEHHKKMNEFHRQQKEQSDYEHNKLREQREGWQRQADHDATIARLNREQANRAREERERSNLEKQRRAQVKQQQKAAKKSASKVAKSSKTNPQSSNDTTSFGEVFTSAIVLVSSAGSAYFANLEGITGWGLVIIAVIAACIAYWARKFLKWVVAIGGIIFLLVYLFGSESYAVLPLSSHD